MILGFSGTRRGLTPQQRAALPSVLATLPERVLHGGAIGADEEFHRWLAKAIVQPHAERADEMDQERKDRREAPSLFLTRSRVAVEIYPTRDRTFFWRNEPSNGLHWMFTRSITHDPMEPLERNRIIAERCDHLLACPAEPTEQLRSGTWSTVRYARKAGKPITLILPDGSVVEER